MTSLDVETSRRGEDRTTTAMRWARGLLLLAGVVAMAGGVYFTFFAAADEGGVSTAGDWVVAVCALALAAAYLAAGARLGSDPSLRALKLTAAIVAAHVVFGLVKLIGYEESESVPFFVVDLGILASLRAAHRYRAR